MENPIDKKLAQQIVDTVKDVCGQNVNFIDHTGIIYASTDEKRIGSFHEIGKQAAEKGEMMEVDTDSLFAGTQKGVNLPVFHNGSFVAVIGISGPPDQVRKYAYLAERITGLLIRERELNTFSRTQAEKMHYVIHSLINRENLSKAYLLDLLEHFRISRHGRYRLLLIHIRSDRSPMNTSEAEQKIQQMFARTGITLFTFNYPSEYLAVLDNSRFPAISPLLEQFSVSQNGKLKMAVGKSCPVFQLSDSCSTGAAALKSIASSAARHYAVFDDLTLELILASVDEGCRTEYLHKTLDSLDGEDISLLSAYFEEDMSLGHTSSRLFLHKNTLQYKLDRIYKKCGLNPRKFRDAAVLYLALKLT